MYYACMVALQIRDVPDDVRRELAGQAATQGQSLQAYLLMLVTKQARRSAANRALLQRFAGRDDGTRLSGSEATDALDAARAEREAQLAAQPNGDE